MLIGRGLLEKHTVVPATFAAAMYTGTTAQTTANVTYVPLAFNNEVKAGTFLSRSGDFKTFTFSRGGRYLSFASTEIDHGSSVINNHFLQWRKNGTPYGAGRAGFELKATAGYAGRMSASTIMDLAAGDTVDFPTYQYGTSTTAANIPFRNIQFIRFPTQSGGFAAQAMSNIVLATSPAVVQWGTEIIKDAGITHDANSDGITLVEPGYYIVGYTLSMNTGVGTAACNIIGEITLNGSVETGTKATGSRLSSNANAFSASYQGIIKTTAANTVLRITAAIEDAQAGNTLRATDSFCYVQKLPANDYIKVTAAAHTPSTSGTDYFVPMSNNIESVGTSMSHSTTTNNSRITINEAGTYLFTEQLQGLYVGNTSFVLGFMKNRGWDGIGQHRAFTDTTSSTFAFTSGRIYDCVPGDCVEMLLWNGVACSIQSAGIQAIKLI